MKTYVTLLFLCLSLGLSAQNKTHNLADFAKVKVFDGLSVKLIKATENKAVVSGEHANAVEFVQKNNLLKIRLAFKKSFKGEATYISLYYTDLYLLDANEGAYIFSEETIEEIDLDVLAQEKSEIKLNIITDRVTAKAVTGSTISLSGKTKTQRVTINSKGEYKGKKLMSDQCEVSVSAGGSAKVHTTDIVKASVKAGGDIRIYGRPRVVDQKKVLGGTITVVD